MLLVLALLACAPSDEGAAATTSTITNPVLRRVDVPTGTPLPQADIPENAPITAFGCFTSNDRYICQDETVNFYWQDGVLCWAADNECDDYPTYDTLTLSWFE